jgi:aspartate kinase
MDDCKTRRIVVIKIGGSVFVDEDSYRQAARFLERRLHQCSRERIVVVVSAQKGLTDELERLARGITGCASPRSVDLLWSTGEMRSVAVLALYLEAVGVSAVGLNVHETGLEFSSDPKACPSRLRVTGRSLEAALAEHAIVVVPGFLATRSDGAIVSLGRGGSDLSAVLLAIGLGASQCELVKDVSGYFEDDPRRNARALHLPSLSFRDALQMADRGCELVQARALLAAAEANLTLVIHSMDERAPVSVIHSDLKSGSAENPHDEPLATGA